MIITVLLSVKGLMIGVFADCDTLKDDHIDNLLDDCKTEDIETNICQNLELEFENAPEEALYGGEYSYIGTVKIRDDQLRPFYRQAKRGSSRSPLYMYHNGHNFVGTPNPKESISSFESSKCVDDLKRDMDFEDFVTCSGDALVQDASDPNGDEETMNLAIKCSDSVGLGTAGTIGIIVAVIIIIALVVLVILIVRKRRQHKESIGMHVSSQI